MAPRDWKAEAAAFNLSSGANFASALPEFEAASRDGAASGLIAAAELLKGEVRKRLQSGYTSGDYVTGNNIVRVQRSEPVVEGDVMAIRVGSTQISPPYPLFWELGHHNVFLDKFVRVEVWRPALLDSRNAMAAAFAEGYRRRVSQARPAPPSGGTRGAK